MRIASRETEFIQLRTELRVIQMEVFVSYDLIQFLSFMLRF